MVDQSSKLAHMMVTMEIATGWRQQFFSQCIVEASQIAENDYVKTKSKYHQRVLEVSF
jgi:hypothetical protein